MPIDVTCDHFFFTITTPFWARHKEMSWSIILPSCPLHLFYIFLFICFFFLSPFSSLQSSPLALTPAASANPFPIHPNRVQAIQPHHHITIWPAFSKSIFQHPNKVQAIQPCHHLTSHQHHQQNTTLLNNRIKSRSANTKQNTASRPNHHKHTSNQMRPKLNSQKASTMPPSTIKSIPKQLQETHTEHKPTNHHLNRCYEPPSTLTWSPKDLLPQTHIKSYHLG